MLNLHVLGRALYHCSELKQISNAIMSCIAFLEGERASMTGVEGEPADKSASGAQMMVPEVAVSGRMDGPTAMPKIQSSGVPLPYPGVTSAGPSGAQISWVSYQPAPTSFTLMATYSSSASPILPLQFSTGRLYQLLAVGQ